MARSSANSLSRHIGLKNRYKEQWYLGSKGDALEDLREEFNVNQLFILESSSGGNVVERLQWVKNEERKATLRAPALGDGGHGSRGNGSLNAY